ncbi:MAG: hypothetical protein NTY38_30720 [Acidobacteria bacterium]|nr:hypothetical protein [Acidobacteriota bacterium]
MRTLAVIMLFGPAMASAGQPRQETVDAFDRYVKGREAALEQRAADPRKFLWAAESGTRLEQVKNGRTAVEPRNPGGMLEVPGGIIHDWAGAVFIPEASLHQVVTFVQNYDHHKDYYKPEVVNSKLLSRDGNTFKIFLRLLKKKVITVVYDTEHTVVYRQVDNRRWQSRSVMTRSREVDDPGKPGEHPVAPEKDHGFLWRLNSYWRFEERDGGVYVECEAITLSRTVPTGVGWLVNPIVKTLPRQSLEMTLDNLHSALAR